MKNVQLCLQIVVTPIWNALKQKRRPGVNVKMEFGMELIAVIKKIIFLKNNPITYTYVFLIK